MTNAVNAPLAASRPLGVASELGATVIAATTVFSKTVVLTGESAALSTQNGRWCFVNSLRLLARVVGKLQLVVPPGATELKAELEQLLSTLWSQGAVRQVEPDKCDWANASAILNVGGSVRSELPWTSIIANGWIARCTSSTNPLPPACEQDNPISCMFAASLGVTEVFKRVYGVPHDKAPPMEDAAYSLFDLSDRFDGVGPELPSRITLPSTLLLGAGAIGNGLVLLGSQLNLSGRVLILDREDFGEENFGTCALLDRTEWLKKPKALMLASWLENRSDLDVEGLKTSIEDACDKGLFDGRGVDLIINGLDKIEPRRAVQKLWARLTVDGAINSVGAAVITHSMSHRDQACLRCAFDEPKKDHIEEQAKLTGLSRKSLQGDQNRQITNADIENAAEEMKPFLREQQRLRRPICSTMQAAQAAGLGVKLEAGFQPSVPFVATAAAALVWAQALRALVWPGAKFVHRVQLDSLFLGPHVSHRLKRPVSPECDCVRHAAVIDRILASRNPASRVT